MRRHFPSVPSLTSHRSGRRGRGHGRLGAGTGAKLPARWAERSIVISGLIGWGLVFLKVGLSTTAGPKAFAVAAVGPILLMMFPLLILTNLGPKGARVLAWVWGLLVTGAVLGVWFQ